MDSCFAWIGLIALIGFLLRASFSMHFYCVYRKCVELCMLKALIGFGLEEIVQHGDSRGCSGGAFGAGREGWRSWS